MKRSLFSILVITAFALATRSEAADGTWNTLGTGNWSDTSKWSGSTVADGLNSTATFSWLGANTETATISVDTARTIGNITTSGITGTGTHAITINGPSILTLDTNTGTAPTITSGMGSRALIINATLAGSDGVRLNVTNGSIGITLGGANTYTGLTDIIAGTVSVTNNLAFGSTTGATTVASLASIELTNGLTVTGETLNLSGNGTGSNLGAIHTANNAVASWTGGITLNTSARIGALGASSVLTLGGAIGETGGSRSLSFSYGTDSDAQGTVVLSGASTYTGTTTIYRGTVKLDGGNDRLPTGSLLIMGGVSTNSTFDLNARNQQINGLSNNTSGASTRTVTNTSGTASVLTINSNSNQTFLGDVDDTTVITGNLSVVKAGSSIQTLAKTNSYTGNTTINSGTLVLADNSTMTFFIGANHVNNGISGSGTLTLDGDFIFNLGGADLTTGNSWNIVNTGTLSETFSGTFTVQGFTGSSGVWTNGNLKFTQSTGVLEVVPEPSTAALLLLGGASALCIALRRRLA